MIRWIKRYAEDVIVYGIVAQVIVLALAYSCNSTLASNKKALRAAGYVGYVGESELFIDKQTGCQYLIDIYRRTTPRLGSDGRPLCKKDAP